MNYRNKAITLMLAILLFNACDTNTKDATETSTDSVTMGKPAPEELNSDQSVLLQTILGKNDTGEGVLRGISFGDPINKVKATETFEMFEETADHLGYTSETPQLETIDIQYFLSADKKVNRITVDVYLNSEVATKDLWLAGKSHFTKSYRAPQEKGKLLTWTKNAVRIAMEDVSKGKDFGLKLHFAPADKNVLAVK